MPQASASACWLKPSASRSSFKRADISGTNIPKCYCNAEQTCRIITPKPAKHHLTAPTKAKKMNRSEPLINASAGTLFPAGEIHPVAAR
jgi:hypothetical protein